MRGFESDTPNFCPKLVRDAISGQFGQGRSPRPRGFDYATLGMAFEIHLFIASDACMCVCSTVESRYKRQLERIIRPSDIVLKSTKFSNFQVKRLQIRRRYIQGDNFPFAENGAIHPVSNAVESSIVLIFFWQFT